MKFNNYTSVLTGLGGQGLISILKILGSALMRKGYNVISSETHGLSQRGGKVTCFLRFGDNLNAPIPMIGTADMIISMEKSTILDVLQYSKPDRSSKLIISTYEKKISNIEYPSMEALEKALNENSNDVVFVPTKTIAEKYKNFKILNIFILGFILRFIPLRKEDIESSLNTTFSGEYLDINLKALHEGCIL